VAGHHRPRHASRRKRGSSGRSEQGVGTDRRDSDGRDRQYGAAGQDGRDIMEASEDRPPATDHRDPSAGTRVRRGTVEDAPDVARLHASAIAEGFLAALGPPFLTPLYARIARDPKSFLLVVPDGPGQTAGFIAGSSDLRDLYRTFVLRDGVRAALPVARRLIRELPRVFETLRHGAGGAGAGRGTELLAVAVDPSWRGRGLGRVLVRAFLDEVVARGGDAAQVVVGAANTSAVALYRQAGFVESRRFELHSGTESLLLEWVRPSPSGADSGGTTGVRP